MPVIDIPSEYGYVLLTVVATTVSATWHAVRTMPFRKKAGVEYPNLYATQEQIKAEPKPDKKHDMYLFNCVQRAHANFLEHYSTAVIGMLIGGLEYPIITAATGLIWNAFRVAYAVGYTRADKNDGSGRLQGSLSLLVEVGLIGLAAKAGWSLLNGSL